VFVQVVQQQIGLGRGQDERGGSVGSDDRGSDGSGDHAVAMVVAMAMAVAILVVVVVVVVVGVVGVGPTMSTLLVSGSNILSGGMTPLLAPA
jgi:hypothetical protein